MYFHHADWLGTGRVRTWLSGSVYESCSSLPFGDGLSCSGPVGDVSTYHFTDKERDAESGLDYRGARYYSSTLALFSSIDPSGASIQLTNPQSWNRYDYVLNNPVRLVDRNGKWPTEGHNAIADGAFPN